MRSAIAGLFLAPLLLIGLNLNAPLFSSKKQNLSVSFPVSYFLNRPILLDPKNTNTVWDYYLLENLAVGLLRDDQRAQSGFRPLLAKRWRQSATKSWTFWIRRELKWSDGSPITIHQIKRHFEALVSHPPRHARHVTKISNIAIDENEYSILFEFNGETDLSFLDELSLADMALVYPSTVDPWSVVSGSYSIQSTDASQNKIRLVRNPYFDSQFETTPKSDWESIDLIGGYSKDQLVANLKSGDLDLYLGPPFPFDETTKALKNAQIQFQDSPPTAIYFFYFNSKHPNFKNVEFRRAFSSLIQKSFNTFEDSNASQELQMIPLGFDGRISPFQQKEFELKPLIGQTIQIEIFSPLEKFTVANRNLETISINSQINLKIKMTHPGQPLDPKSFAGVTIFDGNQKNSIGSWSFLFSPKTGPIGGFHEEAKLLLDTLAGSGGITATTSAAVELHKMVLDQAYVVPFMSARKTVFHSKSVTIERLNHFDLRPRFSDVHLVE